MLQIMATIKTILDTRRQKVDGTFNIIYRITHQKKVYTISSGIAIDKLYWNERKRNLVKAHPNHKLLNLKIAEQFFKIQEATLVLDDDFTITKLRNRLDDKHDNTPTMFKVFSQSLIDEMLALKKTGNALVYQTAVNRLVAFCGKDIPFDAIDYVLLEKFRHHLLLNGLKQNSISNYFRTIRAIYNKAIKHKITDRSRYPFYDISIKSESTAKRAISKEEIRRLHNLGLDKDSTAKKSLDYFMLSFYLRGISFTDLAYLKHSNIIDGRIHYNRRKTHKTYSIKLFSPAEEIINCFHTHSGDYLLPILGNEIIEDSLEAKKVLKQWIKTTNKYLKRLAGAIDSNITITTYTSRHAFATIAKRLGYSNELIAEALGHEYGNKITNIYLDAFDTNKIDGMHYDVIALK
jgi:site-specific recombinase XerD